MDRHISDSPRGDRIEQRFSGLRLLGLGFWQAWWMSAMCTGALLPTEYHYPELGSTTMWVLVLTTLGYLAIAVLAKRFSPLNASRMNFMLAAGLTAAGSFVLPFSLTVLDGAVGIAAFLAATVSLSIGNAMLLIMWGELWSALATGRVGRHLYFSYAFAFVLFFIVYFLPAPIDAIVVALLPIASAAILRSCKDEPRRSPSMTPIDLATVPVARIFACIFLISILYGLSQGLMGTFAGNVGPREFTAQSLLLAGGAIAAIALSMVISQPEAESVALYRPIIPAMAAGFVSLLLFQEPYVFVGGGLIVLGIYCLDMLIMLTSTDIAYRARIPVALSFGAGILASRTGTLCGSLAAKGFLASDAYTTAARDDLLLAGVLVLIFIGTLFFTQSDIQRLYRRAPAQSDAALPSLQEKCAVIAEMCSLTAREAEVLVLLARGKTVKGVCEELTIAQGTAKHHVSNIYRKVGVYDRPSLHAVVEQGAVGRSALDAE